MKFVVYTYVWASSWSGRNRSAVWSDHVRLVLARDTIAQDASEQRAVPDSHSSSPTSAPWRAAYIDERRAVTGAGVIGMQVTSKRSERTTCRSYYSCCAVLLLCCSLLHYKSVTSEYLGGPTFKWMGLLSNGVSLLQTGWACFRKRGFSKIRPPSSLSSNLSSSPMGVISRAYGRSICNWNQNGIRWLFLWGADQGATHLRY